MANEYSRYGTRSYGLESSRPFGSNGRPVPARVELLAPGHPALRGCGASARLYRIPARYGRGVEFEVYRMHGRPRCFVECCPVVAIWRAIERVALERVEDPLLATIRLLKARPVERVERVEFQQAAE